MCEDCPGEALTRRLGVAGPVAAQVAAVDPVSVAEGLSVWPRAAWAGDDRPPTAAVPDEDVRFLLVHHTADRLEHAADDVPAILRAYYDFHTGEKGWPDIAYNFVIDRFGRVWETHDGSIERALQGYATGGNQGFSQLVCLIGDFTGELPTPEALDALTRTLAWLAERDAVEVGDGATATFVSRGSNRHPEGTEVTTPTITGHRTMSLTSCPGDTFFSYVESELPAAVASVRAASTSTTEATTSTTEASTTAPPTTVPSTASSSTTRPTASGEAAAATAESAGPGWGVRSLVVGSGLALLGAVVGLRRRPGLHPDP